MRSSNDKSDRELLQEIRDRSVRTETRVTQLAKSMGVETRDQKPYFRDGAVHVETPNVSFAEIMQLAPKGGGSVEVRCRGRLIGAVENLA